VAINPNLLRADLARNGHAQAPQTLACCPPRSLLTPVTHLPSALDRVQPQVSILDSDELGARSMAQMLQAEGYTARSWTSATEFITHPEPPLAGCLIASVTLPDMTGLELQREIAARQWPLPVIFLTAPNDITTAVRGMKAGAINCLPKPVQWAELLEAVREAFSESRAVRAQRATQLRVQQMLEGLTPREREVLDLAVTGLLVKQIAARLGTAEKTVKTHKGRLMRKMQVRSTLALVQLMMTAGFSPLPPAVPQWDVFTRRPVND
jgi:RNA polymerase sigma factor (sigma-70 family)